MKHFLSVTLLLLLLASMATAANEWGSEGVLTLKTFYYDRDVETWLCIVDPYTDEVTKKVARWFEATGTSGSFSPASSMLMLCTFGGGDDPYYYFRQRDTGLVIEPPNLTGYFSYGMSDEDTAFFVGYQRINDPVDPNRYRAGIFQYHIMAKMFSQIYDFGPYEWGNPYFVGAASESGQLWYGQEYQDKTNPKRGIWVLENGGVRQVLSMSEFGSDSMQLMDSKNGKLFFYTNPAYYLGNRITIYSFDWQSGVLQQLYQGIGEAAYLSPNGTEAYVTYYVFSKVVPVPEPSGIIVLGSLFAGFLLKRRA